MANPADIPPRDEPDDARLDLFEDDDEFEEFEDEEWDVEDEKKLALQQWEDDWDDDDVNDDFSQQLREELDLATAIAAAAQAAVPAVAAQPSLPGLDVGPAVAAIEEAIMQDRKD